MFRHNMETVKQELLQPFTYCRLLSLRMDADALRRPAVIIDNGSRSCKAGFSGDNHPQSIIRSVVGHAYLNTEDYYVGREAFINKGLVLNYPVERGIITHWNDMDKLWNHIYRYELKCKASSRPVLLTEPPLNPFPNRAKTTDLMFERFQVPALYLSVQATLAVYASARVHGLVADIGEGMTHTVPIYDGYCLPHGVVQLNLAGKDISDHLSRLLWDKSHSTLGRARKIMVKGLKEKFCYVALDHHKEEEKKAEVLQLPCGNIVKVNFPLWQAPEILFSPKRVGVEAPGLPGMITHSILRCDKDLSKVLFENVILSGGSSLFRGLGERIYTEFEWSVPKGISPRIRMPPKRSYAAWLGGSIITFLSSFGPMWFTRKEYDEFGADGIHRKCF